MLQVARFGLCCVIRVDDVILLQSDDVIGHFSRLRSSSLSRDAATAFLSIEVALIGRTRLSLSELSFALKMRNKFALEKMPPLAGIEPRSPREIDYEANVLPLY